MVSISTVNQLKQQLAYYCYYFSYYHHYYYDASTIKDKSMKLNIGDNIELKFGLYQKTLCACRLSKRHISRMDMGIKLELSENA